MEADVELTDNILWLLKQAFYYSLTTINDAMKIHGVRKTRRSIPRKLYHYEP